MEMAPGCIRNAPGPQAGKEVWRTYERLGSHVNRIAAVLRAAGYRAQAGSPLGGDVSYPMLAQKAGIGYMGKHGLLITPDSGPSLRIAAIYTEIENLPYTDSTDHAWVRDFCETCLKCVKSCPAGAIYRHNRVYGDGSRQCIDYTKCAKPFSETLGCSVCIRDCTFFTGDYYTIKRACERKQARRSSFRDPSMTRGLFPRGRLEC
jgi:epoxyqueuosine reductase QueG